MSAKRTKPEARLLAGEHELLKAKHLLNGLCQLLWADDEPDVDVLRTLSDSLWDQMERAIEELYPSADNPAASD